MNQSIHGLDTVNDLDPDGVQDISVSSDEEPPAKEIKGKHKATDIEEIIRPTTRDWTDIPKWKEGAGSPLMELPLEILDMIFCVRPELNVSSHISQWDDER
jgi:hypothetical protein